MANSSVFIFHNPYSIATNLVIGYGQYQIVFALYALVLTVVGVLLTIMWLHAIKNKLIDENLTRIEIHGILLESILSPVVFFLSILVSIIDLIIAYYFWLVLIPTRVILRKKYDNQSLVQ